TNAVGDQAETLAAPRDPILDVLQNNGGPTFTRALLAESTAANAGNPAAPGSGGDSCAATDQRGRRRPDGIRNSVGRCDIGAFEASGPITCLTPPSGMVAWWDGDNTANDISGNHNVGTLQNGAGFAPGKVGQSFKFDGVDDFASITNNSSLDLGTGDFTIDLWVKL